MSKRDLFVLIFCVVLSVIPFSGFAGDVIPMQGGGGFEVSDDVSSGTLSDKYLITSRSTNEFLYVFAGMVAKMNALKSSFPKGSDRIMVELDSSEFPGVFLYGFTERTKVRKVVLDVFTPEEEPLLTFYILYDKAAANIASTACSTHNYARLLEVISGSDYLGDILDSSGRKSMKVYAY